MFISCPYYAGKNHDIKIGKNFEDVIKLKYSEKIVKNQDPK
jgi:hypothetical protein